MGGMREREWVSCWERECRGQGRERERGRSDAKGWGLGRQRGTDRLFRGRVDGGIGIRLGVREGLLGLVEGGFHLVRTAYQQGAERKEGG